MPGSQRTITSEHTATPGTRLSALYRVAGVLILIGAGVLWVSTRFSWVTVTSKDDKAGSSTFAITGSQWSAESTVCAVAFLVAGVSVFFLGKIGRRTIGVVTAFVAVFGMISPLTLLISGGDPDHARLVLVSDTSSSVSDTSSALHSWAEVDSLDLAPLPILCALMALLLVLAGACLVIWRPGRRHRDTSRFTRKEAQGELQVRKWADEPESGRALWDALDSGQDPTVDASPSSDIAETRADAPESSSDTPEEPR